MITYSNFTRQLAPESASLNAYYGPFTSIQAGVQECKDSLLKTKAGALAAKDGTIMAVKDPESHKITLHVRNTSLGGDIAGWEEVGKDISTYITRTDGPYDILTVVFPDDVENPVEYELNKRDTFTTTYGEITISSFTYPAIPLNGGTVLPTINFTQNYHEDHTRIADVDGIVPRSDASISYSVAYTQNANSANAGRTIVSSDGSVTREGTNPVAGQRCKIADVTATVTSHGKTATATYAVYQVVVANKTYTVASSSLSYPTLTNAGSETIEPTVSVTTRETITYTEGVASTSSTRNITSFGVTYSAGAGNTTLGDTVASHLNTTNGQISGIGRGTYRLSSQTDAVKTSLATITANISVQDPRDASNNVLTATPTWVLKQDTRAPEIISYDYKAVVTSFTYDGTIDGDGGSVDVDNIAYKIQHRGNFEDGTTESSYSNVSGMSNLTLASVDANRTVTYAAVGDLISGASLNASTGTVTRNAVGSVSSTTNVGTVRATLSTTIVDEASGASKTATGSLTAAVTQAVRQLYVYFGSSYDLLAQNAVFDRTNSRHITSDSESFNGIAIESTTNYVAWIAVPDGWNIAIIDPLAGNITSDYNTDAVTTTGYKIYQYEFSAAVNVMYTLQLTKQA